MRLVEGDEARVGSGDGIVHGLEEPADVEVDVAERALVHVDVDDRRHVARMARPDRGLLERLAPRRLVDVLTALDVPARLEPASEPDVAVQEDPLRTVDDDRGAGDVGRVGVAVERRGEPVDEPQGPAVRGGLARVRRDVRLERGDEPLDRSGAQTSSSRERTVPSGSSP